MRGRGFTLIEVLFAIFVGLVLIGAAYLAMTSGQQSSASVERKVAAQQDVRGALQTMALELSMASFNPNYISGIWHDLPPINGDIECLPSGDQRYKGIREATPVSVTIEMDLGESNQVGDEGGEIVRYAYDTAAQFISRETANCGNKRGAGAAAPFLGINPASKKPRTVRVINKEMNIANPKGDFAIFRYYDGRSPAKEIFPYLPAGSPDEIPDIRRIEITLGVETDEVDPTTKGRKQMTYTTSVAVRNHALIQ